MQATMLGVGSGLSKPPSATPGAPPVAKKASEDVTPSESEVALPAPAKAAPKPPPPPPPSKPQLPGPPARPVGGPSGFKGTIVSAVPAPQQNPQKDSLEFDLPSIPDSAALPLPAGRAAKGAASRPFDPIALGAPPPTPRSKDPETLPQSDKSIDFSEFDLPTPAAQLPARSPAGGKPFGGPPAPGVPAFNPKPSPAAPPKSSPGAPPLRAPAPASSAGAGAGAQAFGSVDLPSAQRGNRSPSPPLGLELDLPIPTRNGGAPAPTLPKAPPAAAPPVPPSAGRAGPPPAPALPKTPAAPFTPAKPFVPAKLDFDAFGEIDLPAIGGGDLPAVSAALPAVSAGLPAVAASLPSVADALPSVADAFPLPADALPVTANVLPVTANVMPVTANVMPVTANVMPAKANVLPTPSVAKGRAAPISIAPEPISAPPEMADFGELDLPPPPAPPPPAAVARGGEVAFSFDDMPPLGDIDLPPPPPLQVTSDPPPPPPPPPPAFDEGFGDGLDTSNDSGFGEVDLAVADISAPAEAEEAIPIAPPPPPEEGAVGTEQTIASLPRANRAATATRKKAGKRVIVALLAIVVVGGGALELTQYGAFGRLAITDVVRANDYERILQEQSAAARRKMASDLFVDVRAASDQLAAAHAETPRARGLTAFAALVEYEAQLRFGDAAERVPRVKQWVGELAARPDTKYLNVAQAAQEALVGDPKKARTMLDAASKRDIGDPIQEDVALLRGDFELGQKDAQAALAAFTKAGSVSKTARSEFGRARALILARDLDGAKKAIEDTFKLSPNHGGAHVERAKLLWEAKDEAGALADIAAVLEGPAKPVSSALTQAEAYAMRGFIHVARGRAAEARNAFDAALKLDPRNVRALVGQGEVLFNEGRFTEALTRFDTAVQADGSSVLAIVSDAKAKLSLERLADAKTQIAAARAKFPKDWRVAFWLGKAELALGNKPAAEKELLASLELIDPLDPDAIQPYVALASLYAGQGKTKEAEAKISEAKTKLADSASLRRALGEVAASRGDYDGAVQNFRISIEKDPMDLSTRFRLGVTLRRMRKVDEASAEFDKILAADKDYPGLALERGLLYEESGDIEKALDQFKSALAKAPDDVDLQLRVGAAYASIERPDDAIPTLRKVIEKRPRSAEANHFLGRALFLKGGSTQAEAMRYLKTATELDPNRAEYWLYVGWAANNAIPAQVAVAKDSIEKALAIDKLLADGYWQRGVIEGKSGAYDDAITDLHRALELKPTRHDAHAMLGFVYEKKNDPATAIAEYQKAVSADETNMNWRFDLGKLLYNKNSFAEASKHLVFAADAAERTDGIKPGWLADAEFLAADTLRKTGKKPEAIERYRKFLEIAPSNSPFRKEANAALSDLGAAARPH